MTQMSIPHSKNIGKSNGYDDVIHLNLFDVCFDIDDGDILSNLITKMTHDYIIFNDNYDTGKHVYFPFELLNKYIGNPISVKIKFHQKDGTVMFYFKVHDFCFTGYSNFFDLDYSKDSDIKFTKVFYTCSGFEYFNENDIKRVRMDKIAEIFEEGRNPDKIIKIENLFQK